jgi:hypothetical protein
MVLDHYEGHEEKVNPIFSFTTLMLFMAVITL